MKLLVTGVTGFISSIVAAALLRRGDTVLGIDNLNPYYDVRLKEARLARLKADPKFSFTLLDVAARDKTVGLFTSNNFDAVVHLAAQAGVRYNPHAYGDANLTGFLNILEGCRQAKVKHLVYASSSSVYGSNAKKVNVLAFKENTPNLRNSRVIDVIQELQSYGVQVFVHDPVVSPHDAKEEYGIDIVDWNALPVGAATILAVAHKEFLARPISDYAGKTQRGGCLVDVKAKLDPKAVEEKGLHLWRL